MPMLSKMGGGGVLVHNTSYLDCANNVAQYPDKVSGLHLWVILTKELPIILMAALEPCAVQLGFRIYIHRDFHSIIINLYSKLLLSM